MHRAGVVSNVAVTRRRLRSGTRTCRKRKKGKTRQGPSTAYRDISGNILKFVEKGHDSSPEKADVISRTHDEHGT
jgi:hypothetical protein